MVTNTNDGRSRTPIGPHVDDGDTEDLRPEIVLVPTDTRRSVRRRGKQPYWLVILFAFVAITFGLRAISGPARFGANRNSERNTELGICVIASVAAFLAYAKCKQNAGDTR